MTPLSVKGRHSAIGHAAGCVVETLEARRLLYAPVPDRFTVKVGEMLINSRTEPGASGYVQSLAVQAGRTYYLKASGSVTMAPGRHGDAEYFDTQTGTPGDYKLDRGDFGVRLLGDQGVNGTSPYKWGSYESGHIYTMQLTAPSDILTGEFVDSKHSDNYGSVKVEVFSLPVVSILASDADASENNRDTGEFMITRSGSSSAADVWVYFRFQSASSTDATPPQLDSYGNLSNEAEADFELSGAEPVTEEQGLFKAKVSQGENATTVTITPQNDSTVEGVENVHLVLVDDIDASAPAYAAPGLNVAQFPMEADERIGDVQAIPGTDEGAPTHQMMDGWIAVIASNTSTPQERDQATDLLKAAYAAHPSIEEYVDVVYDYAFNAPDAELRIRLEQVLGPVRLELRGNQIIASVRFQSAAAPFGYAVRLPLSDEDLGFSVPGQPNAAGVTVGGDPTAIDLTPYHEFVVDKTVTFQVEYLDENGDAITPSGYRREFILKAIEVNSD